MQDRPVLYGFDGSTYARTVRMVLADKQIDYENVQVNVLRGEPGASEHLERHPFGKIPVLDIDGLRLRETDAICRYLDDTRAEPALVPSDAVDRARMNEAISVINSYGYDALIGVAGHHLFPAVVGGRDEERLARNRARSETTLQLLMANRADRPWLAGAEPSLADYLLGPLAWYLSMTRDGETLLALPGMADWWRRMQQVPSFAPTAPPLG